MDEIFIMLVLKTTGEIERFDCAEEPDLKTLQRMVGGYIEVVPHLEKYSGRRVVAFCNEEGRLRGLPRNDEATRAWRTCLGDGPFSYDPVLHGDVVIYGKR